MSRVNFDGVLFDLDGTLLDTAPDLGNALNHVLDQYGHPLCAYEDYRVVASDGALGLLQLGFGERYAELDVEHARGLLLDFYLTNICVDTQPFDGVLDTLNWLNQHDIPWGIVTNKPEQLTLSLLQYFPIIAQCKSIIGGDTLSQRKPHPLPLLHCAEQLQLNVNTQRCLYVGDALRDIEAAQSAKMPSVIARYGYIKEQENIQNWRADYTINHISELLEL